MWSSLLYGVSSFFCSHLATPLGGHPTLICKEFPHFLWLSILLCDYTVVQLTILQSLGILITSKLLSLYTVRQPIPYVRPSGRAPGSLHRRLGQKAQSFEAFPALVALPFTQALPHPGRRMPHLVTTQHKEVKFHFLCLEPQFIFFARLSVRLLLCFLFLGVFNCLGELAYAWGRSDTPQFVIYPLALLMVSFFFNCAGMFYLSTVEYFSLFFILLELSFPKCLCLSETKIFHIISSFIVTYLL